MSVIPVPIIGTQNNASFSGIQIFSRYEHFFPHFNKKLYRLSSISELNLKREGNVKCMYVLQ